MDRWRNHFFHLLNVHGVNKVRKTEIHTAEPAVPEPSALEVHIAVGKLKIHKSAGMDQIPAQFIKAEGRTTIAEIFESKQGNSLTMSSRIRGGLRCNSW